VLHVLHVLEVSLRDKEKPKHEPLAFPSIRFLLHRAQKK
jgi:hypothetical protein